MLSHTDTTRATVTVTMRETSCVCRPWMNSPPYDPRPYCARCQWLRSRRQRRIETGLQRVNIR